MCYHTTYLFSLCGHTSISKQPVKQTPPCRHARNLVGLTHAATNSNHTDNVLQPTTPSSPPSQNPQERMCFTSLRTTSFPSPQEFEFAKELHSSIPASPTTPTTARSSHPRDSTFNILDAYTSLTTVSPSHTQLPPPSSTHSQCPKIIRHPLHTFAVPTLCVPCARTHLMNIARFEALTIKESVDRENWGYRKGLAGHGVVEERKRITRRSAGKGKLIPLICVEEGRLRTMQEAEDEVVRNEIERNGGVEQAVSVEEELMTELSGGEEILVGENIAASIREPAEMGAARAEVAAVGQSATVEAVDGSGPAVPSSGSGWSWWGRGATARFTSAPAPMPALTTDPPQEHTDQQRFVMTGDLASTHKKTPSTVSALSQRMDWSSMQERWKGINNNVARDVFGRNAKGMNRIMGWDRGTGGDVGERDGDDLGITETGARDVTA